MSWGADPLEQLRSIPKWGFIIYRCDYRDDGAWKTFMDQWSDRVNEWLLYKNAGHLVQTLEFTVKEDRAALDGATVEQVQKLFTTWVTSEEAVAEQEDVRERGGVSWPRYSFCIHVDDRSLDGCLRYLSLPEDEQLKYLVGNRDPALGQAAYVNLIKKYQEVRGVEQYDDDEEENDDDDDDEEEEEEEKEENEKIVAVKMHLSVVLPDAYTALGSYPPSFEVWSKSCEKDGVCLY